MNQHKVLGDTILATKDTIYVLQLWRDLLVRWQTLGEIELEVFADTCQQLKDAGLWQWAREAGGHGIEALANIGDLQMQSFVGEKWSACSDLDIAQLIHRNTAVGQHTKQRRIGSNQR
jgi:hypothetical protein